MFAACGCAGRSAVGTMPAKVWHLGFELCFANLETRPFCKLVFDNLTEFSLLAVPRTRWLVLIFIIYIEVLEYPFWILLFLCMIMGEIKLSRRLLEILPAVKRMTFEICEAKLKIKTRDLGSGRSYCR